MKRSVAVLLSCVFLAACAMPVNDTPTFTFSVYFTPGPGCENAIVEQIKNAQTMRIAVYAITNPRIGDAIIAAHGRGADVRIISDRTQAKNKASLTDEFRAVGVPVVLNHGYKIEHNKFAVFDNKTLITGSYNWTTNATMYNSENCIVQNAAVDEYVAHFDELWKKYTNH